MYSITHFLLWFTIGHKLYKMMAHRPLIIPLIIIRFTYLKDPIHDYELRWLSMVYNLILDFVLIFLCYNQNHDLIIKDKI